MDIIAQKIAKPEDQGPIAAERQAGHVGHVSEKEKYGDDNKFAIGRNSRPKGVYDYPGKNIQEQAQ